MAVENPVAATDGDVYIPMSERTGEPAVVYFTRELSAAGMMKAYEKVNEGITGKVAVKLHTGEPHGPNFTPSAWIKEFVEKEVPGATIVETNTAYPGKRYTTEDHLETLHINGWDEWTKVDIMDDGDKFAYFPVEGGKWFDKMSVGANEANYDSLVVLTHFKGHGMGGFGGSDKNLGIGCASGHEGKFWIHSSKFVSEGDTSFDILQEELMERITESTKATIDHFKGHICYVNVMRNMSVDCDCAGTMAAAVTTPNVGVLSSLDICAVDTACVDIVWAMSDEEGHDLKERIQSRKGLRQLSYMQELGMGTMNYKLLDLDNDCAEITVADCVKNLVPFEA